MKYGALGQGTGYLVPALDAKIRPLGKCPHRQLRGKIKMSPVGFVHQKGNTSGVAKGCNSRHITYHTVIIGRDQHHRPDVRLPGKLRFHRFRGNTAPELQSGNIFRHHPYRHTAGEDQPHKDGFVGISRHQHLISGANTGQQHSLIAAGGAVYQEPAFVCTVEIRCQILGLLYGSRRGMQIVQSMGFRHIVAENSLSCILYPLGIYSPGTPVTGNAKVGRFVFLIGFHCRK